jgi:hypothetical protein
MFLKLEQNSNRMNIDTEMLLRNKGKEAVASEVLKVKT